MLFYRLKWFSNLNKWLRHIKDRDYDLSLDPFLRSAIIVFVNDSSKSVLPSTSLKKLSEDILVSIVFLNSFSAIPIAYVTQSFKIPVETNS